MSLLWLDGYEWLDQSLTGQVFEDTMVSKARREIDVLLGTDAQVVTGRGGRGNALQWGANGQFQQFTSLRDRNNDNDLIIGFAVKIGTAFVDNANWISVMLGVDSQSVVRYETSDNTFRFLRANGTLLATSPADLINLNTWYYMEVKIRTNDTTGFIIMRLNGQIVWESATTLDSADISGEGWDTLRLDFTRMSLNALTDDLYICDTGGTINNDFLGDVAIETILPVADGDFTQWSKNTGADHVAHIDDVPFTAVPEDTDYVETGIIDNTELFKYAELPSELSTPIFGVLVHPIVKITNAGEPRGLNNIVRSKNKESVGLFPLNASSLSNKSRIEDVYFGEASIFETEPRNGQQWTVKDINNAQFGVRHVA